MTKVQEHWYQLKVLPGGKKTLEEIRGIKTYGRQEREAKLRRIKVLREEKKRLLAAIRAKRGLKKGKKVKNITKGMAKA